MAEQALSWAASEVRDRAYRAGRWRLATLSSNECAIFCGAWDCAPYPADPVYLLDFLHSYSVGRFTLDNLLFDLVPSEPHGCRL
ncbi:hypothetical protein [Hoeflea sp.]|uniref:hypothetical protein n=1 Tax=Hoeflea sp. TaxID=1940281 RepID=UPI0025BAD0B2|nr:hypothetical protein [Hoeflea sp.]